MSSWVTMTSSSTPPDRCQATCRRCGARAPRGSTTSSTATPAWGNEIPAAMGAKLAAPDSEVVAIVGDGGYQMLLQEIATIVSENLKVIIVLLQNHGFASIGGLSESRGSQRFGTNYRMRNDQSDRPH